MRSNDALRMSFCQGGMEGRMEGLDQALKWHSLFRMLLFFHLLQFLLHQQHLFFRSQLRK